MRGNSYLRCMAVTTAGLTKVAEDILRISELEEMASCFETIWALLSWMENPWVSVGVISAFFELSRVKPESLFIPG